MLTEARLTLEAIRSLASEGRPIRVAVVARFLKARRHWLDSRIKVASKKEVYLRVWDSLTVESSGRLTRRDFYQAWIVVFGRAGVRDDSAVSHREVAEAIGKIVAPMSPGMSRRQAIAAIRPLLGGHFPERTISQKVFWHGWDVFCKEHEDLFSRGGRASPVPLPAVTSASLAPLPKKETDVQKQPEKAAARSVEKVPGVSISGTLLPVTHTAGIFPSSFDDAAGDDDAWPFALRPWEELTKRHGGVLRIPDAELSMMLAMLTKIDPDYLVDCGGGLFNIRANHIKALGLPRDYVSPEALAEREYWRQHGRNR